MDIKVSASVLSVSEENMANTISQLVDSGIDMIHFDILDGKFVDNKSFDYNLVNAMHKQFPGVLFDVHLMTIDPLTDIDNYISCADIISLHLDTDCDIAEAVAKINNNDIKSALVVNANVDVEEVVPYLDCIDMVLIMSVQAGYGGQKFMPECLNKIAKIRQCNANIDIEVDGGITAQNANDVITAGANVLVSGSTIINAENMEDVIRKLRNA